MLDKESCYSIQNSIPDEAPKCDGPFQGRGGFSLSSCVDSSLSIVEEPSGGRFLVRYDFLV